MHTQSDVPIDFRHLIAHASRQSVSRQQLVASVREVNSSSARERTLEHFDGRMVIRRTYEVYGKLLPVPLLPEFVTTTE